MSGDIEHLYGIVNNKIEAYVHKNPNLHYMGDFPQPQQKYAGPGEKCNTIIAVIFSNDLNHLNLSFKKMCLFIKRKIYHVIFKVFPYLKLVTI